VRERRGITAETALRLARLFGTSVELWMNRQQRDDLERAKDLLGHSLDQITPMHLAG
jgi:addiction module HigA family antidote